LHNDNRIGTRHRRRVQLKYGLELASRIGFTEDVSDDGFFIKTGLVERPGSLMQLELNLPDGVLVQLTGRVSWAKRVPAKLIHRIKGGMGIKIIRFNTGEVDYRRYCADLNSRYGSM